MLFSKHKEISQIVANLMYNMLQSNVARNYYKFLKKSVLHVATMLPTTRAYIWFDICKFCVA